MKGKVNKLDVDKLVLAPVDLSKLTDVVKYCVVKSDVHNAIIKDIEHKIPDITNLATNTTLHSKVNEVEKKMPSITNLVTNASFNAKINEVKSEIPSITDLATTAALTTVENKILDHSKYILAPELSKLTAETFTAGLKQLLATKGDIADFVKMTDCHDKLKTLNKKVNSNKSKHLLDEKELKKIHDKIEKLQIYDSSLFIG